MKNRTMPCRAALRPLTVAALLACGWPLLDVSAQSLPQGASLANGAAVIKSFDNGLLVTNGPGTILNWNSFSIGAGRKVQFDQQTAASAVLNRVTGSGRSDIDGTLQSNGRVFLLNPNGIVFGAGARVDTAGLLASTLNMSDADFLAGTYRFACFNNIECNAGASSRVLLKDGSQIITRTAGPGGQVWLVAKDGVTTEKGSLIDAPSGQVIAAAAREVTIGSDGLGQMTFTLNGTSGSLVNMAGAIDVSRGAAGFFADTVRLSGTVRARSEVGAAGQITANASSQVVVDGDARLDVSGTSGASAGAVRLGATQKVTVAASALIDASGLITPEGGGGVAGLIELSAAEVQLPGALAGEGASPDQLDVMSYLANGSVFQPRSGQVRVLESGNFDYSVVQGNRMLASGSQDRTVTTRNLGNFLDSNSNYTRLAQLAVAGSGDGNYLVVTERKTTATGFRNNIPQRGSEDRVYEMHLFDGAGNLLIRRELVTDTRAVGPNETTSGRSYQVLGLSKGGFVLVDGTALTFLSANGAELERGVLGDARDTVRPLLGGGLLVEGRVNNVAQRTVYDAAGRPVSDVAAALASEKFPAFDYNDAADLNFDGQREVGFDGARQLAVINRASNTIVQQLAGIPTTGSRDTELLATVNRSGLYEARRFFQDQPVTNQSAIGITNAEKNTHLLTAFQRRELNSTGGVTTAQDVKHDGWYVVDSNRIAFFTLDTTSDFGATRVVGTQPRVTSSQDTESTSLSLNVIQRSITNVPFAASTTTGQLVTPLLLATQPGLTNGERTGGVVTPPVDPNPGGGTGPGPGPVTNPGAGTGSPPPTLESRIVAGALPPPVKPLAKPAPVTGTPPGLSVPASVVRRGPRDVPDDESLDDTDPELLAAARILVEELLGPEELKRFDNVEHLRDRSAFMQEAANAQLLGPELYAATRNMDPVMRVMLFNTMSTLQAEGLHDNGKFSEGLTKALTEPVYTGDNPDGSRGPTRTALFVPLSILQGEMEAAKKLDLDGGKQARDRVQGLITRELVIAGMEAAGEEVSDTGDVVFKRPDGSEVRITEEGNVVSGKTQGT